MVGWWDNDEIGIGSGNKALGSGPLFPVLAFALLVLVVDLANFTLKWLHPSIKSTLYNPSDWLYTDYNTIKNALALLTRTNPHTNVIQFMWSIESTQLISEKKRKSVVQFVCSYQIVGRNAHYH